MQNLQLAKRRENRKKSLRNEHDSSGLHLHQRFRLYIDASAFLVRRNILFEKSFIHKKGAAVQCIRLALLNKAITSDVKKLRRSYLAMQLFAAGYGRRYLLKNKH